MCRMNRFVSNFLRTGYRARNGARCFSSGQEKVLTEVDTKSGICTVRLNGPPVNMLDSEMLLASVKAAKDAEKNKEVKGIILTSNKDGVFCAGLNIMDMYEKSHDHYVEYWTNVQEWYLTWYGCSKPTAAVINGHAPAGGCAWAMMCDYRIMQGGAKKTIGLNETQLGIVAPFFFVELIRSTIGNRASEAALLKGTLFQAEDALKHGVVDAVDSIENLIPRATEELQQFMAVPQQAYYITKFLMRQDVITKLKAIRKEDAEMFAQLVSQPSVQKDIGMYVAAMKAKKK